MFQISWARADRMLVEGLAGIVLEAQHREGEKGAAQQHQQQAIEKHQPGGDRPEDHCELVGVEHIAQPAHGADQLGLMAFVDLAAQMADIDIHDIGQALEGLVPDLLHDHAARQDAPGMQEQIFQQGIFLGAEFDALAVALDLAGQAVDLQRSDLAAYFPAAPARAAAAPAPGWTVRPSPPA